MPLLKSIAKVLTRWLMHDTRDSHTPLCDFERIRHEIKPCDVLLVEGSSRVSEVIKQTTQSPWSHAMLYIGRIHDIENEEVRNSIQASYQGALDEQLVIESELLACIQVSTRVKLCLFSLASIDV